MCVRGSAALAGVALLAAYLLTGVVQVRPGERAVVRRFGRVLEESLLRLPETRRQSLRQRWLDGRQQSSDDPRAVWLRRIGLGLASVAVLGLVVTLTRRSPDDDPF